MNTHSIMIIDDEPWTLIWLKKLFDQPEKGFQVVATERRSVDALLNIPKLSPEIIMVDIRMPEINGLELIKQIRADKNNCVIIIISGFSEFTYAKEGIYYGVFEYLLKPVDAEQANDLLERISVFLDEDQTGNNQQVNLDDGDLSSFSSMLSYINQNYASRLYLNELAQRFHLNANYCCSLFQSRVGTTFSHYVMNIRLEKAKELLCVEDLPINRVGELVGYDDIFYFSKIFKKEIGLAPSEYRRQRKGNKP